MDHTRAAILLAAFSPRQREEIVRWVLNNSGNSLLEVEKAAIQLLKFDPALGFIPDDLNPEELACLFRGLRVVLGDAMAGQWTSEQYALALTRSASISPQYAKKLADDEIVTPDENLFSFAHRLLLQGGSTSGITQSVSRGLGLALDALEKLLPSSVSNKSQDSMFEIYQMGKVLGKLTLRATMAMKETQYENPPITLPEGTPDESTVMKVAMTAIPMMAKSIIGLLAAGGPAGLLNSGTPLGGLLSEGGDLIKEHRVRHHTGTRPQRTLDWLQRATDATEFHAPVVIPDLYNAAVAAPERGCAAVREAGDVQSLINRAGARAGRLNAETLPRGQFARLPAAVHQARSLQEVGDILDEQ